jgi:hypothetical protein
MWRNISQNYRFMYQEVEDEEKPLKRFTNFFLGQNHRAKAAV